MANATLKYYRGFLFYSSLRVEKEERIYLNVVQSKKFYRSTIHIFQAQDRLTPVREHSHCTQLKPKTSPIVRDWKKNR